MREGRHHRMSMTRQINERTARGGSRNEEGRGCVCALQASKCVGHGGREEGSAIVGDEEVVR